MSVEVETPMKLTEIRKRLGVGQTYFCALKRMMGLRYSHMGRLSDFSKYISEHPSFRQTDVYHASGCVCQDCKLKPRTNRGRPRAAAPKVEPVVAG